MTEVSSPPEYASTTFLIGFSALFLFTFSLVPPLRPIRIVVGVHVSFIHPVHPFTDDCAPVRRVILPVAVRLAVLPLTLVPTSVRRLVAPIPILQTVLPFAGVAPTLSSGKGTLALSPAFLQRALIPVCELAAHIPLHQALAIRLAVFALAVPGDRLTWLRERVGHLATVLVRDPCNVVLGAE